MRSSSSVVTPGATALPTATSASAASREATRIRSMVSASLTSEPRKGCGSGLSTYSGRSMDSGTGRRGLCRPGRRTGRTLIGQAYRPCRLGPVGRLRHRYRYAAEIHRPEQENLLRSAWFPSMLRCTSASAGRDSPVPLRCRGRREAFETEPVRGAAPVAVPRPLFPQGPRCTTPPAVERPACPTQVMAAAAPHRLTYPGPAQCRGRVPAAPPSGRLQRLGRLVRLRPVGVGVLL